MKISEKAQNIDLNNINYGTPIQDHANRQGTIRQVFR
jgi:hypothetical protein